MKNYYYKTVLSLMTLVSPFLNPFSNILGVSFLKFHSTLTMYKLRCMPYDEWRDLFVSLAEEMAREEEVSKNNKLLS